jgi:hypothetical protein
MLRRIFSNIPGKQPIVTSGVGAGKVDENTSRSDIDNLHSLSRQGLWGLLIFLAASAVAFNYRGCSLSGTLPAGMMEQLGPTPDVILVNIVLGVSTFCSLVIIGGRIYNDHKPSSTWTHLWFRVFFYLLYFISGALNDHFNVAFISGLVVLALQHCNNWNHYQRIIEASQGKWDNLHPWGRGVSGK